MLHSIISMKECGNRHTWREIGEYHGITWQSARGKYLRRDKDLLPGVCPACKQGFSPEPKPTFKVDGNYGYASSCDPEIESPEQLIAYLNINLDEWIVKDKGAKVWNVGAKLKTGELYWADGGIVEGYVKYHGLGKRNLWSVYVNLVRRHPEPVFPVLHPIVSSVVYDYPQRNVESGVTRTMLMADPQFGFERNMIDGVLTPMHDRDALDLAYQVFLDAEPDALEVLGDIMDFGNFTDKFWRSPKREYTTQSACQECHWTLGRFRAARPDMPIRLHVGNHDARLARAIATHLRAGYGLHPADDIEGPALLSIERLLGLESLGIELIGGYPNDEVWLADLLRARHGTRAVKGGGKTAAAVVQDTDVSEAFGHVHRKELATRIVRTGRTTRPIVAYSPGCMCRTDEPVVPGYTMDSDWHLGFGFADHYGNGTLLSVQDVVIWNKQAVWNRSLYTARDVVPYLEKAYPRYRWR